MGQTKIPVIMLLALCCTVLSGQPGLGSQPEDDLLDYGACWMPLTQGNAKTFQYTSSGIDDPLYYTQTVSGTEIIKGLEAVKVVMSNSGIPYGPYAEGSYEAFLPDTSERLVKMKTYYDKDPVLGSYSMLYVPFTTRPRSIKPPVEGEWFQVTQPATCLKDKSVKFSGGAVDTCMNVVTVSYLGFEDVTVPAGTFKDCLKTWVRVSIVYAQTPQNNMGLEVFTWEAPGLGVVKTENIYQLYAADFDFYPFHSLITGGGSELISATVDGVSYPQE